MYLFFLISRGVPSFSLKVKAQN